MKEKTKSNVSKYLFKTGHRLYINVLKSSMIKELLQAYAFTEL